MKIGVEAFISENSIDPGAFARRAEELGFESFFLPEHPIIPVVAKSAYPASAAGKIPESLAHLIDPLIGLTLAAAATTRIGLGTGICLVPEHDPINLAKAIATLDHYSGGRVIFGIGAGWLAEESEIMGVNFKRRWLMTREYVRAMKELWTRSEASFAGEFVNFPAVRCYPKPVCKPHPPILIGAGGMGPAMDRGLRDTVAIGDGWMPLGLTPDELVRQLAKLKRMCADAGRDFAKLEITMHVPRVDDEPRRIVERYREAGAHRLIFILDAPTPDRYERQLADLA
ncbi:MAG: LLM class F420-dependent oxidoreductase, partial [Candidatus Binataceae bacterium]